MKAWYHFALSYVFAAEFLYLAWGWKEKSALVACVINLIPCAIQVFIMRRSRG